MKGIYKPNGDLSIKGMIFAVILTCVIVGALDGIAYLGRSYLHTDAPESGVYGYLNAYVTDYNISTQKVAIPLELRDEEEIISDPHIHVYPVKNLNKVVAKSDDDD